MPEHASRLRSKTVLMAIGFATLPYLAAMTVFWLSLASSPPAILAPESYTLRVILAGLLGIGLFGIGAAIGLLRRCLACEAIRESLAMETMSEQFIEAGKMASIGELAAGIAHEINNPVAIMVEEAGWMEDLLQEDAEMADSRNFDELRRALGQIRTQGARCKDITHKMLSFARKSDPRMQEVHLAAMIRDVGALSENHARYANARIELNLAEDLPSITASASEIQQVLLNLFNNALDALEGKGGAITVTTRKVGDAAEIAVADTGMGIPKANLSRIFDPFFTTKPVGKGTGLGLSICYTIIKNMGGDITVASQINVGTTITIRLPLTKDQKKQKVTEIART
ncbi:sensor histidine kinase [Desulfonatronum sp. SC1]|uniref:sensor histidine kinase n=1 Tax=Desulfonatronum sp. SC1 TaxID=2109626 RepID=UPI001E2E6866|nr:ATP-binding protein [Desulfonatronum sp. SC1]